MWHTLNLTNIFSFSLFKKVYHIAIYDMELDCEFFHRFGHNWILHKKYIIFTFIFYFQDTFPTFQNTFIFWPNQALLFFLIIFS